jgi:hypothetical protein
MRAGVSRSVASRALDIAQPDEKVLRLSEVQPEFKAPIWDYLGFLVMPVLFGLLAARSSSPECARPGPALREVSSIDGVLRSKRGGRRMQEERKRFLRNA